MNPAPGELEHLRTFVNTVDFEDGIEQLKAPADLAAWFGERGFLAGGEEVSERELEQALEVREALRKLMLANNGAPLDPAAVETLNAAAKTAELTLRVKPDGDAGLAPVRPGFDGALARLLAIAYRAMADGSWQRLKACGRHSCEWAFYDNSRNHSATWCDMTTCGNREKARAYRERRRSTTA